MATSVASRARIRLAAERGEAIPEGWAVDRGGQPTREPQAALEGSLLPVGRPKGFGLVLTLEVLSAVLTGASFGWQSRDLYVGLDGPQGLGHFFATIPIAAYGDSGQFAQRMGNLSAQLRSIRPAAGSSGVRLPGERAEACARDVEALGVLVATTVLAELRSLGRDLAVTRQL